MTDKKIRVRFAPSPTGGLHLGGVRTVLFNYLFAKKNKGDFIVRIEDTDQTRYVPGAEEYIFDCLKWCGLEPNESPIHGGPYGPYRQSERKEIYKKYAEQLVQQGNAYYAFDTPEELEAMREKLKSSGSHHLQYDMHIRLQMKNSLTLSEEETTELINKKVPHVVRIKVMPDEKVELNDMIRGHVEFDINSVDDKVLLKADGMPTYHLAVVVDDYLMKITHAFRGEEWLPSAPVHVLLWKYLFGLEQMPEWAHLPLILKPDGNGKLSKRDGDRLGFPVFAMDWKDPNTNEITKGFKEIGFLPEAFINLLALLGWNDGSQQEIFAKEELINKFSMERVHKGGAKFDFEKAKWYNHEWIKKLSATQYINEVKNIFLQHGVEINDEAKFLNILNLVKERCTLLNDFWLQANFFYVAPVEFDVQSVLPKWDVAKKDFFTKLNQRFLAIEEWTIPFIESEFKSLAGELNIKIGDLQMLYRIMLVGSKIGPGVFAISEILGKQETIERIQKAFLYFNLKSTGL